MNHELRCKVLHLKELCNRIDSSKKIAIVSDNTQGVEFVEKLLHLFINHGDEILSAIENYTPPEKPAYPQDFLDMMDKFFGPEFTKTITETQKCARHKS